MFCFLVSLFPVSLSGRFFFFPSIFFFSFFPLFSRRLPPPVDLFLGTSLSKTISWDTASAMVPNHLVRSADPTEDSGISNHPLGTRSAVLLESSQEVLKQEKPKPQSVPISDASFWRTTFNCRRYTRECTAGDMGEMGGMGGLHGEPSVLPAPKLATERWRQRPFLHLHHGRDVSPTRTALLCLPSPSPNVVAFQRDAGGRRLELGHMTDFQDLAPRFKIARGGRLHVPDWRLGTYVPYKGSREDERYSVMGSELQRNVHKPRPAIKPHIAAQLYYTYLLLLDTQALAGVRYHLIGTMGLGILEDRNLERVPGTSLLNDVLGSDQDVEHIPSPDKTSLKHDPTGKIVLVPQPSDHPDDPFNWPRWKKELFMLTIAYGTGCVGGKYIPCLLPPTYGGVLRRRRRRRRNKVLIHTCADTMCSSPPLGGR